MARHSLPSHKLIRGMPFGRRSRISRVACLPLMWTTEMALGDGPLSDSPTQRIQRTVRWQWHVRPTDSNRSVSVCVPEAIQQQSVLLLAFPTTPAHSHNGSFCMHLALPKKGRIPRTLTLHPTDHLFVLGQSSSKALHV